MSLTVDDVRRWNTGALSEASKDVSAGASAAADARLALSDGSEVLREGWEGRAADAVLDAAELERSHATKLFAGLEDLADALSRAEAALGPAARAVRNRIADAVAAGLEVDGSVVRPGPGKTDVDQDTVDSHAEAVGSALSTVRSLDEHYGREIDQIASRLHAAIPAEVDRSPIPGPDDPWPGRGVDAMTRAMSQGLPALADELDPLTRGKHKLNPAPDDFGRAAGAGLRGLGRIAAPVGIGVTTLDGVTAHARGETSTGEAVTETVSAVGGGMAGGAAAGALAGSWLGPVGAILGAGVGAAVGTELGKNLGDWAYERVIGE